MFNFPNINGSLVPIDDRRIDLQNTSCLSNSQTAVQYDSLGSKSSVIIRAGSLQPNRTYQFMTRMTNLRNPLSQATGYILVQVVDASVPIIVIE